jgi:hypothetical protein
MKLTVRLQDLTPEQRSLFTPGNIDLTHRQLKDFFGGLDVTIVVISDSNPPPRRIRQYCGALDRLLDANLSKDAGRLS